MNITSIAGKLFLPRQKQLESYLSHGEELQHEVLKKLIERRKDTEYGRKHLFNTVNSYEDFISNVSVNTYEELKGDIDRMRHGEEIVLWRGQIKW